MSWTVIKGLKEDQRKVFADAKAITEVANKEKRDLTADENANHAKLIAEVESFGARIEREEKNAALSEKLGNDNRSMSNSVEMPNKDFKRFSILRALSKRINNQPIDGIEKEISDEIALRTGKQPTGFYVPMEAAYSTRALNTSTGAAAIGVTLETDVIELLRNALVLNQAGATIMANMNGKFSIPRQTGGATAYWLGDGGSPTASNQTMDQVAFTPKTVGAFTDISRQFVNQTSIDAEAFVRNDLAKVLANAIDVAGLSGTGSSNQPTGIINTAGVGNISHGTNGGAETWSTVVGYEKLVLAGNISPAARFSYVFNSFVNAALKTTDKTSGGYGQFIMDANGKVNSRDTYVTNALLNTYTKGTGSALNSVVFGNFADLVIALWGGLDLMVDPYTGSSSGTVRVVALQDVDIEVRHPQSFAVATDVVAS